MSCVELMFYPITNICLFFSYSFLTADCDTRNVSILEMKYYGSQTCVLPQT